MTAYPYPALEPYLDELITLCEINGVTKLYAFGSVVSSRFDPASSDIDLLVELMEMPPVERGETLIRLWDALEDLFQRKVDLLTEQSIKNPYFKKNIENTKKLIYDRQRQEVPV